MRIWIDLANSPHILLLRPVVERLRADGDDVLLSARDHAQTLDLARAYWPEVEVIGGSSPGDVLEKGRRIFSRAASLRRFAQRGGAQLAFSHGSYAQLIAAASLGMASVTMMDYEHQPANHLSFRLARRVIVPAAFPEGALRRCGARRRKVVRYEGFKEELYLADGRPDYGVVDSLGLDPTAVLAVFRPPPEGALYHRTANERFEALLDSARSEPGVETIVLPRGPEQRQRYARLDGVAVPARAVDSLSVLASADLMIGGGGTMTRVSALLGTPTYTVFAGRLAAVDAALIREGRLIDARWPGVELRFEKRLALSPMPVGMGRAAAIMETVIETIRSFDPGAGGRRRRSRPLLQARP